MSLLNIIHGGRGRHGHPTSIIVNSNTTVDAVAKQLGIKGRNEDAFVDALKKHDPWLHVTGKDSRIAAGSNLRLPGRFDEFIDGVTKNAAPTHTAPNRRGATETGAARGAAGAGGPSLSIASQNSNGKVSGYVG